MLSLFIWWIWSIRGLMIRIKSQIVDTIISQITDAVCFSITICHLVMIHNTINAARVAQKPFSRWSNDWHFLQRLIIEWDLINLAQCKVNYPRWYILVKKALGKGFLRRRIIKSLKNLQLVFVETWIQYRKSYIYWRWKLCQNMSQWCQTR